MRNILISAAILCGSAAIATTAWANKPNQGNMYIVCKDGSQQFYTAILSNNLNSLQQAQNAAARQGAIDRCGPGNYTPEGGGPRTLPVGTGVSAAVNPRSLGAAAPRVTLAQTSANLSALVATPRFAAMRRARDYRGMSEALAGIGVAMEAAPEAAWKLCLPPQQWIWAQRFIDHGNGMSSLSWVQVCGWPGDANPN